MNENQKSSNFCGTKRSPEVTENKPVHLPRHLVDPTVLTVGNIEMPARINVGNMSGDEWDFMRIGK